MSVLRYISTLGHNRLIRHVLYVRFLRYFRLALDWTSKADMSDSSDFGVLPSYIRHITTDISTISDLSDSSD